MDQLLTVKQVAELLQVSESTVVRYLQGGKLKGVKLTDGKKGKWRIQPEEIQKFLNRGTAQM